jgi:hypothetical protein
VPPGAPTLAEMRRSTADRIAPCEEGRSGVSPLGSPSTRVGTAQGANRRRVVSSDLAGLDAIGSAPEAPQDAYRNEWLFVLTDPPEMRRIPEAGFLGAAAPEDLLEGYDASTVPADEVVAGVDVERPFSAVVPAGTSFEIHGVPPLRAGRSLGYHEAIRHACRVILREDTIAVPGSAGKTTLDVTASFPWLSNVGLFIDAHYEETTTGVETWAVPGASLRFDGSSVLLTVLAGASSGGPFPVRVLRPIGTWVKPAGAADWAESVTGPVSEGDQVLGDRESVAVVAAFYVAEAEALASQAGSAAQGYWLSRAQQLASRSPFLKDQRQRRGARADQPWPDLVSVEGPFQGRFGPGFR